MARAGIAKTRLLDGERMDIQTGQAFGAQQPDTLTETANNAGVTQPPLQPSIDVSQVDQPTQTPPDRQPTAQQTVERSAITSAVADDTQLQQGEDILASRIRSLSGRSADESKLMEEAGITDIEREIADIGSAIKRKRADLTAELETLGQQGFRATAVRGQEARGRRQVAAEIAGLEAAQAAAQGQLTVAESSVQRALDAKYGPIEEDIAIQQELISLRKDQMTREEKKLAEQRERELIVEQRQVEETRALEENANNAIMTALSFGNISASKAGDLMGKLARDEISASDVISAVGGALRDPVDVLNQQIKGAELEAMRRIEDNRESGVYTEEQAEVVNDLTTQLRGEPAYKEMFEIRAGYNTAKTGFEQNNGFGDIAMVNGYQRMIDPGATVRGEDIKTQAEAVSYVQQALGIKGRILTGDRFTEEVRKKLDSAVNDQYANRVNDFESTVKSRYDRVIERNPQLSGAGVTFEDIGDTFSVGNTTTEPVNPESAPVGSEIILDGVKYLKVGQNAFEPVTE